MGCQATLEEIAETIDRSTLHQPSAGLRSSCHRSRRRKEFPDRRKSSISVIADVIVVPLDKDGRPLAEPFIACSLNVSAGGMCFYHSEPIDSTLLYVEIASPAPPGNGAQMRVLRQRHVGDYFELPGQFFSDWPPNVAADDSQRFTLESVRHRASVGRMCRTMTTLPPAEIAADCQAHCPRFVAVLRRERTQSLALAARLREWGIAAVDVESTVLLSKLVAAKLVELLIIDHHIEGFITGMEVVQKMRMAFVRIPVIVLGPNVEMLRQESNVLGPVTFTDAGKSTEDLANLARRVLSRPPQDFDLIPERAHVLVERQIDLPVLSQLIVRLVGYFRNSRGRDPPR